MKILLIEPPFHRFMGFYRFFFPFSLSSLAAYLKNEKHDILIYDADHGEKPVPMTSSDLLDVFPKYLEGIKNLDHPIWKEMEALIKDFKPDLIGITYMSTKMGSVINIAGIAKNVYPDTPVVLGGAHPSVLHEKSLEQVQADFVVIGEGEVTFSELIKEIERGGTHFEKINGLAFRTKEGKMITTPHRPLISDLDSLPFPDRESLYKLDTYRPDDLSMIMTSRGCPYNCTFCSSIWERRTRNRSNLNIIQEIEYLIDRFQTKNIYFKDDTFTINKKRVFEFCDMLKQKNIEIEWECLTRIELTDEELVLRMRDAGMVYMKIGIETGSPRLLKSTNKNLTINQIKKGAEILNKLGQKWSAFFMLGYPDETEEEIYKTWDLIKEIRPTYVSMSTLAPYPGCEIYYDLKKTGAIREDSNWNLYDPFSLEANVNQVIEPKRFRELVVETMKFIDGYNLQTREK
jgi:radical SAM superfamily enzyme YgiQ (UPF0313 family)